jgi:hypothetical protein
MSTYADPYLNELVNRILAYRARVPRDEQEARDIALAAGKLAMQLQALGGTPPP